MCSFKGKLFSKIPMCKYYFVSGKGAEPPLFAFLSSDLKQRYFFHEKETVILITVPHFLT